jgi:peptidoglycan/xylan/chitin deacetylase (PgdA/CDA1 family)
MPIRQERLLASLISQLFHFTIYKLEQPRMQLEESMLIVSVDVDVGDRLLGVINKGRNDSNVNRHFSEYVVGKIEEIIFPYFLDLFDEFEIPITFAIRGQLATVNSSILELLLNSPVSHDLGAHGYSHKRFKSMSRNEAEEELSMISEVMKDRGIIPRSFVFPGNSVAHLDLLEKYGYKCYRSYGNYKHDRISIEKNGPLYDVRPSLNFCLSVNSLLVKKTLDVAISKKAPFHLWFHMWEFGETKESARRHINRLFRPLLNHAAKREKKGVLTFETMYSAAKKVENMSTV